MTLQASKLGSSPLMLDWSGLQVMSVDSNTITTAWTKAQARIAKKDSEFYHTPIDPAHHENEASVTLANRLLETGKFHDVLFLGIGGSALGPMSMLYALKHRRKTPLKFHFMENPDAIDWTDTVSKLDPDSTLVVVVTKSGTTYETISQFLIAQAWLKKERWSTHIVAITDPKKGDLRAWADKNGIMTLPISPTIGGRFTVFTPVGLFASALAGFDNDAFLNGAKSVRDYCENTAADKNLIFTTMERIFTISDRHPIHVLMPYSTRLKLISNWFVQLWGESLGKDGKGYTPVAAVGATDQHSLLQLLRDGPNDKITGFITIQNVDDPAKIPSGSLGPYSSFEQLRGKTLHDLLTYEYKAIAQVLSRRPRPNWTLSMERLDEASLGALYFFFSVATAYMGERLDVNPYDQPGVEEGKIYIREYLK